MRLKKPGIPGKEIRGRFLNSEERCCVEHCFLRVPIFLSLSPVQQNRCLDCGFYDFSWTLSWIWSLNLKNVSLQYSLVKIFSTHLRNSKGLIGIKSHNQKQEIRSTLLLNKKNGPCLYIQQFNGFLAVWIMGFCSLLVLGLSPTSLAMRTVL